jgi:hypothetical protein
VCESVCVLVQVGGGTCACGCADGMKKGFKVKKFVVY